MPCELVLLAMGFLDPERPGMLEKLGVRSPTGATSGGTRSG